VVLAGGGDAGSEMVVAPGSGPSLFSPLFSFSSSLLCFPSLLLYFFLPFSPFFFSFGLQLFFFVSSPFASSLPLYL